MSLMTEPVTVPAEPAEERRGGARPDWAGTQPGAPLPEQDDGEKWDPPPAEDDCDLGYRADRMLPKLGKWCGVPGCGGD
jgi:hypothetical protein